jgi:hypothetical protein
MPEKLGYSHSPFREGINRGLSGIVIVLKEGPEGSERKTFKQRTQIHLKSRVLYVICRILSKGIGISH